MIATLARSFVLMLFAVAFHIAKNDADGSYRQSTATPIFLTEIRLHWNHRAARWPDAPWPSDKRQVR